MRIFGVQKELTAPICFAPSEQNAKHALEPESKILDNAHPSSESADTNGDAPTGPYPCAATTTRVFWEDLCATVVREL